MFRARWLAFSFAMLGSTAPSFGWNATGHMLVAGLAWNRLSPERRTELTSLLKQHPLFAQHFTSRRPSGLAADEVDRWAFMQAATWPDIVRGMSGAEKAKWHRSAWHYINLPFFPTQADEQATTEYVTNHVNVSFTLPPGSDNAGIKKLNAVQALKHNLALFKDASNSQPNRAVALCWILHLAGDLHQPLHTTAMFTDDLYPEGDHGGGKVHLTGGSHNLHSAWDAFAGDDEDSDVSEEFAERVQRLEDLLSDTPTLSKAEAEQNRLNPDDWAADGRALCSKSVFPKSLLKKIVPGETESENKPFKLSSVYVKKGQRIAETQVTIAGYRLAKLLE